MIIWRCLQLKLPTDGSLSNSLRAKSNIAEFVFLKSFQVQMKYANAPVIKEVTGYLLSLIGLNAIVMEPLMVIQIHLHVGELLNILMLLS
ncbi:serum response factor protein A [Trifolium repens]|nr:serum response factor protein A [Trifolium repens]